MVSATQCGTHNADKEPNPWRSYGHAIAIDPWGDIVGEIRSSDLEGSFVFDIDVARMEKIRMNIPVFDHRRVDLYGFKGEN